MREAMAVMGYVPTSSVGDLSVQGGDPIIELFPDISTKEVVLRVAKADVSEVRVGNPQAGFTLVQLILNDGANVESAIRTTADPAGLRSFHDPILNRIKQEATAKKIMI